MSPLQQFKRLLVPGVRVEVTNHYVTREDHPCFGTTTRKVVGTTGSSFTLDVGGRQTWPKARDLTLVEEGGPWTFEVRGHPSAPAALFLTVRVPA